MSQEMLPSDIFTRPSGWVVRIYIKKWLTNDDDLTPEQIQAIGQKIARTLSSQPLFEDNDVIERFEEAETLEEFNTALDEMYDECDRVRILVQ